MCGTVNEYKMTNWILSISNRLLPASGLAFASDSHGERGGIIRAMHTMTGTVTLVMICRPNGHGYTLLPLLN